jgi:hypothetical protein
MNEILINHDDLSGLDKIIRQRSENSFFIALYHLLTGRQINHRFKICVSLLGYPYISWLSWLGVSTETVYRTLTYQPSLLTVLNYDHACSNKDYLEIGRLFGAFLYSMLNKESYLDKQEEKRHNFIHNMSLLQLQYLDQEQCKELTCLRRIATMFIIPTELSRFMAGEII